MRQGIADDRVNFLSDPTAGAKCGIASDRIDQMRRSVAPPPPPPVIDRLSDNYPQDDFSCKSPA